MFGGGGHSRAAAALVREGTLGSVFEALVNLLQIHVRPTLTVAQIMSYGVPQTLASTATIAEAAERMRRYGFEGFPVVDGGRIVGMLTRREIDRAVHHGLEHHPVSRYMRAGRVRVTPEDSIATLRQVMTEHDWGQVPVVDPQTGEILGIVTRTDLIKQWSGAVSSRTENLDPMMAKNLPAPLLDLLRQAGTTARELGYPLYAVGGFVRDLLLGEPTYDVDLVVEGDAIALAQELARRRGGRVRSHRRFGTAKWILPDEPSRANGPRQLPDALDFVTARTEFYEHPTALPTVERSSIKQDLHRRDFTINTLAVRLDPDGWGDLLDFYGGRKDLDDRLIRVLHSLSFVEDPTRILRAVRFEQRFGFQIEPRTEELVGDANDLLDRVSAERVRHELELIMSEAKPELAVCRLDELGVLRKLHPDLRCDAWIQEKAVALRAQLQVVSNPEAQTPPPMVISQEAWPRLYLALFTYQLTSEAKHQFLERFHIRKEYRDIIMEHAALSEKADILSENSAKPSDVVAALEDSSEEARLLLRVTTDSWLARQRLDLYQRRLRHVKPLLTGDDLRRMGIPPGRVYYRILDRLRAAHLDGEIHSRAEEEWLLQQILAESDVSAARKKA
jgi:tRNA nucleotidyltransferase (CCA-adding enzyme)